MAGPSRFLIPPLLRSRETRDALHEAVIYDVRPEPGSEERHPPYFIAMCEGCDWMGSDRVSELEARRDAEEHTANVRAAVERPLA